MRAPGTQGAYCSTWKLGCDDGIPILFGDVLWCVVNVVDPADEMDFSRLTFASE